MDGRARMEFSLCSYYESKTLSRIYSRLYVDMKKNIRHCWSCKLLSTDDVCKVDNMKKSRNRKGCKQHKIDENLRGIKST